MNTLSFAEKLKFLRSEAGWTQQVMADNMLISKRTIEKWETGKRTPPEYVQRFVLNELSQEAARKREQDVAAIPDNGLPPLQYARKHR